MNQLLLRRRADAVSEKKEYAVQCFNPNVENYNPAVSIILDAAGYGKYVDSNDHSKGWYLTKKQAAKVTSFGTIFRNKQNVVDSNGIVSSDTSLSYPFDNFDEIIYFSSVYSLEQYAFSACSSLTGILKIPSWMNCNAFFAIDIQSTECSILCNHDLDLRKDAKAKKILVNGNFAISNVLQGTSELRINGTLTTMAPSNFIFNGFLTLAFIEVANVFTTDNKIYYRTSWQGSYAPLIHLSYFGVATKPSVMRGNDAWYGLPRVLVGDGSSLENDTQVLNLYMQDTDWASTDMSVSIWWNYNGKYKWYYVTNNLTNFINSNPVEWPYITRNESYNTTIVSNNDTPLSRIRVKMYQAVDDGITPSNPTDITSQVYNASTGEINIPHVTGNVIIEEVPYDAEIEYLQSTGTQYIDTGIITQGQNTRMIIEFSYDNLSGRQLHGGGNYLYFGVNNNRWEATYNSYINGANTQKHTFEKAVVKSGRYVINTFIDATLLYNFSAESVSDGLIYLFALCSNSDPVLYSIGKLYNCEIYVNDVLVWDAIPVRVGQVGYMYDKVSGQLFGNSGTGSFILGQDITPTPLPYDAEIEYLESTGTQYINTGIYADNNTSVSMRARQTVVFGDNCFIGMDEGNSDNNSFCVEYFYTNGSRLGTLFNLDGVMALYKNGIIGDTNWHIISASKNGLAFDGNVYNTQSSAPSTFTATYPLFMYAFGRNGSPAIYSKVSMSYCKMFSNGILVRDFIPVRVGQTGYMYDKISGQLFGNSGTGNFILGPDKN